MAHRTGRISSDCPMTPPTLYQPRTYRDPEDTDRFKTFRVAIETSDLYVKALSSLEKQTEALIRESRDQIKWAIERRPDFLKSLVPLEEDPADSPIVLAMIRAGQKAGTGPMAAVAGAVAEFVGKGLLPLSSEIIIEKRRGHFPKGRSPGHYRAVCRKFAFQRAHRNQNRIDSHSHGDMYIFRNRRTVAQFRHGRRCYDYLPRCGPG